MGPLGHLPHHVDKHSARHSYLVLKATQDTCVVGLESQVPQAFSLNGENGYFSVPFLLGPEVAVQTTSEGHGLFPVLVPWLELQLMPSALVPGMAGREEVPGRTQRVI